jgi:hypothetical protein
VVVVDGCEVKGKEWETLPEGKTLVVGPSPPAGLI